MTGFNTTLRIVNVKVGLHADLPKCCLDLAMPHIVYLAEYSTARPSKVAACELLHALVISAVGEHSMCCRQPNGTESEQMKKYNTLWEFLCPTVFRLAVDVEVVAAQLFEPLALQIVRWFSSNRQYPEVASIVLDAILKCVKSPPDGRLREEESKWLAEFVKWMLKGVTNDKIEESAGTDKGMLRHLY